MNRSLRGALISLLLMTGCSQAAKLVQETETGGIVTYAYKVDRGGAMFSKYRGEALQLIQKKCPSGYTIVREGEAKGDSGLPGIAEGGEDDFGRRWGLQFRCKSSAQ
jgi:hypothetical protein